VDEYVNDQCEFNDKDILEAIRRLSNKLDDLQRKIDEMAQNIRSIKSRQH